MSLYLITSKGAAPIELPNCFWSLSNLFRSYGKDVPSPDLPSPLLSEDDHSYHLMDGSGTVCKAPCTDGTAGPRARQYICIAVGAEAENQSQPHQGAEVKGSACDCVGANRHPLCHGPQHSLMGDLMPLTCLAHRSCGWQMQGKLRKPHGHREKGCEERSVARRAEDNGES